MNNIKRYNALKCIFIMLCLSVVVCFSFSGCNEKPIEPENPKMVWSFDETSCVLTIEVYGAMENYFYSSPAPWSNYCAEIREVVFEGNVTEIGDNAFTDCSKLSSITIPAGVSRIGKNSFKSCQMLTFVSIPHTVTEIGEYAFANCVNIRNLFLPDSITSIGKGAFNRCTQLERINVPEGVTRINEQTFYECYGLESVHIPDSVSEIGDKAFKNCTSLKTLNIPDSVTIIEDYAFADCEYLRSVVVPKSITKFGQGIFSNCYRMINAELCDGITCVENSMFSGCRNLETLYIPDSITYIGEFAFMGCKKLTNIYLPAGMTDIGDGAFNACSRLESIHIPESISVINDSVFFGCTNLKNVDMHDKVVSIGGGAFWGCTALESLSIPESVERIYESSFNLCTNLVLKVTKGSYAESFALSYSIPYTMVDDSEDTSVQADASDDGTNTEPNEDIYESETETFSSAVTVQEYDGKKHYTVKFPADFSKEQYKAAELTPTDEFQWGDYMAFVAYGVNDHDEQFPGFAILGNGIDSIEEGHDAYEKLNSLYCTESPVLPGDYRDEIPYDTPGVREYFFRSNIIGMSSDLDDIYLFRVLDTDFDSPKSEVDLIVDDKLVSTTPIDSLWYDDGCELIPKGYENIFIERFYEYKSKTSRYEVNDGAGMLYDIIFKTTENNTIDFLIEHAIDSHRLLVTFVHHGGYNNEEDPNDNGINRNTYLLDVEACTLTKIENYLAYPYMSPDGKYLIYSSFRDRHASANPSDNWAYRMEPGFYVKDLINNKTAFYPFSMSWNAAHNTLGWISKDAYDKAVENR